MTMKMNPLIHNISQPSRNVNTKVPNKNNIDFNSMLKRELDSITVSKHARHRIENRGIQIDANTMTKINSAMDKLSQKGSKDSLILLNQVAYIVNPQQKVIITAVDKENLHDNIFTGIDSAVIL